MLPAAYQLWLVNRVRRRQAAELAALTYPDTGFAELYRACRFRGYFATQQVESEIVRLLDLVRERDCQTLLEIGTAAGGTLYLLTRAASRHATIISLDIARDPDHWDAIRGFARLQQRMVAVTGNSGDPAVRDEVAAQVAGRPLDFLLIDGDHSAYGVRKDFELYAPLAAPGGLVVLHDISLAGGVKEFWTELKVRYRHEELVGDPAQTECGIGVLYV